jgi:asparagine synthase (glutamine-hydrolysing)
MCGIAGIFNLDGRPCDADDVRAFTDALTHRGPDGSGVFTDGPIGLGHRRLAILDLSEHGHQPMRSVDGRYWITYNGEIFNFLELRRELQADGQRFATDSDTEIILGAYRRWGADCVLRFNGMWAFAIYDSERRELFLSRDRFGVKPLRYLTDGRRFAFASELKAFRHLPGFTPRENESEMRNLLARGGMSMEDTPFEGVKRLPGGYNLLVTTEGIRKWRWWRTIDHLPTVPRRFSEQAEQFRELFFDAVRIRLRSDVPVATCLSGGLDSSSIVCALPELSARAGEREARDCHHAFVAHFPGTAWDEREYAEAAIERAGADPHLIEMSLDAVLEHLHEYAYDIEMCGDRLSIPLWLTYRALRQHGIVVSLDGHGADEMLGGYARVYQHTLRSQRSFMQAPARTLDLIQTLRGMSGLGTTVAPSVMSLVMESDPLLRRSRGAMQRGRQLAARVFRPNGSAGARTANGSPWSPPVPSIRYMDDDTRSIVDSLSPFKGYLYNEFHATTLVNVLRTFDRCSMAHGVEIRMPFMDWRLVSYVFALPEESIAGGGYTKRVLREAMRGVLPEKVRTRRAKLGFSSPLPNWFNGALGDQVWSVLQSRRFLECELWNGVAIRDFAAPRHRDKSWMLADAQRVWRFVQAHLWRQQVFG